MKKKITLNRINLNKSLLFILFVWENFVLHAYDGHRKISKLIHLLLLTFCAAHKMQKIFVEV